MKPGLAAEEEYIAREQADRKREYLPDQQHGAAPITEQTRELPKQTHVLCPQCTILLQPTAWHGIDVHQCRACQGIWLGARELEELLEARTFEARQLERLSMAKTGIVQKIANVFRSSFP